MNKNVKLFNFIVNIFLVTAVIFCIVVVAQTMSKGYVNIGGISFFRVVTGSMEPTIKEGALIINKAVDIEDVEVDDIICFRSQDSFMLGQSITHRVIEIREASDGTRYLETRGDANTASDGHYVTSSNLIGKVIFYTKEGNVFADILSFITSRMGFMACVVFPVLLIAGLIMRDSVKNIHKELALLEQEQKKEEYDAMVERLKKESLEEVKQSVEQEQFENR